MADKLLKKPIAAATQAEIVRFMSKVRYQDPPPGFEGLCWIWTGATSRGGAGREQAGGNGYNWYGTFKYAGTGIRAHRFSCEAIAKRPPLLSGHHRDHLCNVSLCVNPAHIEYVTHEENEERRMKRSAQVIETHRPGDEFSNWEEGQ